MLHPKLVNNTVCGEIPTLLSNINCRLNVLASILYNNTVYMLNKKEFHMDMLILLFYKRILTIKYCDPTYMGCFTVPMIASRVKKLTLNCSTNCV